MLLILCYLMLLSCFDVTAYVVTSYVILCCLGVDAGLALCYRCPIGIRFSHCFLKMLTGREITSIDYLLVDSQVCKGLQVIGCATEQELRDMQLTFEPPSGTYFGIPHGENPASSTCTAHKYSTYGGHA